jgi:hypothetical protein
MAMRLHTVALGMAIASACASAHAAAVGWVEQVHPQASGQDYILYSTLARSKKNVWAVGYHWGTVGGALEFRSYALHWDGSTWSVSPSIDIESAPSTTFFDGVGAAPEGGDVWAVGWFRRPSEASHTLIERWNGTQWSIVPSPNPSAGGNYLQAVAFASTSEGWAVGDSQDPSVDQVGLLIRWNGGSWQPMSFPALPFCLKQTYLTGVAARPGRAFVTGTCRLAGGSYQGFVLQWDGAHWKLVIGPDQLPGSTLLNAVTYVNNGEVWAVGSRQFSQSSTALLLHWVDDTWTEVPPPAGSDADSMSAVAAAGHKRVWAVGTGTSSQPPFAGVSSLHWNGSEWKDIPAGDFGRLSGVDITDDGYVWAVGSRIEDALILARHRVLPPP